jgi:hypothetical protein
VRKRFGLLALRRHDRASRVGTPTLLTHTTYTHLYTGTRAHGLAAMSASWHSAGPAVVAAIVRHSCNLFIFPLSLCLLALRTYLWLITFWLRILSYVCGAAYGVLRGVAALLHRRCEAVPTSAYSNQYNNQLFRATAVRVVIACGRPICVAAWRTRTRVSHNLGNADSPATHTLTPSRGSRPAQAPIPVYPPL